MRVSAVIPAHNEARTLADCLESLLAQTYRHIEIIVVDDGSQDNTAEVARRYGVRLIRHELCRGEAAARTTGSQAATGDIVLHGEADAVYPPTYVENAVRYFRDPEVMAVACGRIMVRPELRGLVADYFRVRREASYLARLAGRKAVYGCHLVRREVFDRVGYYDSRCVVGTDADLALRIQQAGLKTAWARDIYFFHRDPHTLRAFIRRTFKGNLLRREFMERWNLWPKGPKLLALFIWNLATTLSFLVLPLGLVHALFVLPALLAAGAEGFGLLVLHQESRLALQYALKQGMYRLALALPLLNFLRVRSASYGLLLAVLIRRQLAQTVTYE